MRHGFQSIITERRLHFHRYCLAAILAGNLAAFGGVDTVARALTAAAALLLALDLRKAPNLPRIHRICAAAFLGLAMVHLLPLPQGLRALLQPGFAEVFAPGWRPLSLAPWATLQWTAALVIGLVIAVVSARMAATRSGLPLLLTIIAAAGAATAVLGLLAEDSDPNRVLFFRENVLGGSAYGPFVNRNHFAQAMELTIPAMAVLLAAASRRLNVPGLARQRAALSVIVWSVAVAVSLTSLVRCGSRAGLVFTLAAGIATLPWWWRRRSWSWTIPRVAAAALIAAVVGGMTWTRLPDIRERVADLVAVEGLQGNSRVDLWRSTLASWSRAPVLGSGFGTYRWVITLDKPATGEAVLEQAHNDWLEIASTGGAAGFAVLLAAAAGLASLLWLPKVRKLRSDLRYPLAGAALALVATGLHESVGFGLQTPANRYLLFAWVGLCWGLRERTDRRRSDSRTDAGAGRIEETP